MLRLPRIVTVLAVVATVTTAAAGPATAEPDGPTVPAPAIVPFEGWAPASCPAPAGVGTAPTDRVVVHHSHHPTAASREQVLPALAEMCLLHVLRGFDTIGYHYVVDPWGTVYQARGALPDQTGRAPATQSEGAHVHGSNPGAVGVVFLGDHEAEPPTEAAVDAAVHLLAWLVEATGQRPDDLVSIESSGGGTALHEGQASVEVVAGHRATNATLCPGEHLVELLDPIRQRVHTALDGGGLPAIDGGGSLVADGTVRPAPDRPVHLISSGPIYAAPPAEPGLGSSEGLAGLAPSAVLLLLVARLARRPRREARATRAPAEGH